MKLTFATRIAALTLCSAALFSPASQAADDADTTAIKHTLNLYLEGLQQADRAKLEKAFLAPSAHMKQLSKDAQGKSTIQVTPLPEAINKWTSNPARPNLKGEILSVTVIHPNAAVATFDFDGRFLDFFQLIKIDGEWKIVNKTFVAK